MKYKIKGLDCQICSNKLESILSELDYVKKIDISFTTNTMIVEFVNDEEENIINLEKEAKKFESDFKILNNLEYDMYKEKEVLNNKNFNMYISLGLFLVAFILDKLFYWFLKYDSDFKYYFNPIYIMSYLIIAYRVFKEAFISIKKRDIFNEKVLMVIATLGAILLRDYAEASAIMLFYSIGEYFQELSIINSRNSIREVLALKNTIVNKIEDSNILNIDSEKIQIGDKLLLKKGEKLLFDSIISKGQAYMDTSTLTGESIPKKVCEGENIYAGYINVSESIEVVVVKKMEDSNIYSMLEIIENSTHNKSKLEKYITRFTKIYTPIVMLIALLVTIIPPLFIQRIDFYDSMYNGITLLVVACPCALLLSIPLTFYLGIGHASRNSLLIKGANVFEKIDRLEAIYLDKTGTITEGKYKVSSVYEYFNNIDGKKVYEYVYNMEKRSSHVISKSIIDFINNKYGFVHSDENYFKYSSKCEHCGCCHEEESHKKGDVLIKEHKAQGHFLGDACQSHKFNFKDEIEEFNKDISFLTFEEIDGIGLKASTGDDEILIGGKNMIDIYGLSIKDDDFDKIFVFINKECVLSFVLKDKIKKDSKIAIDEIKKMGIKDITILTGDNLEIGNKVAANVGIKKVVSNLLPKDKYDILDKDERVSMFVGDGINDVGVINRADIGVSMGKNGHDITIDNSDVIINNDSLFGIVKLIKLSRKMNSIIVQNLIIIMGVKLAIIVFGTFNLMSMWVAVFGDVGVTIIAILNAMRVKNIEL